MLISLSIRNIVLIESLDIDWRQGLCTLTGETGAGKSILLDALTLVIGSRGRTDLVRQGEDQGSVTAVFEIESDSEVACLLEENSLSYDQYLILRRVQTVDGRSCAFVNDTPISISLLKQIGGALIEIHGQNESLFLKDSAMQLSLLDTYIGHQKEVKELKKIYHQMYDTRMMLQKYRESGTETQKDRDFLSDSIEELTLLDPQLGEKEKLTSERRFLMNSEKISVHLHELNHLLEDDNGMQMYLNRALKKLEQSVQHASGYLDSLVSALHKALIETEEVRRLLSDFIEKIVYNPVQLETVEERLFTLVKVANKHKVDIDQLPQLKVSFITQLAEIDEQVSQLDSLEGDLSAIEEKYARLAIRISERRKKRACELSECVMKELPSLKLDNVKFVTQITCSPIDEGKASGIDHIQFMACINHNMPLDKMSKIASGGELARFMLVIKVVLTQKKQQRIIIFDEIDVGVGGAVAEAVGIRLKLLSENGQVLVVTHSPQVAACGHYQWRITKHMENECMVTQVTELSGALRQEEIARMLSGAVITDEARAVAMRLLGN